MENMGLSGMQFGNWANLPGISETFNKTSKGEFNPLAAAIGYGISQLTGGNKLTQGLQGQGAQIPPMAQTGPAVPGPVNPNTAVMPQVQSDLNQSQTTIQPETTMQSPVQTLSSHPLVNMAQRLLGGGM